MTPEQSAQWEQKLRSEEAIERVARGAPTEAELPLDPLQFGGEVALGLSPVGPLYGAYHAGRSIGEGDPASLGLAALGFAPMGTLAKPLVSLAKWMKPIAKSMTKGPSTPSLNYWLNEGIASAGIKLSPALGTVKRGMTKGSPVPSLSYQASTRVFPSLPYRPLHLTPGAPLLAEPAKTGSPASKNGGEEQ